MVFSLRVVQRRVLRLSAAVAGLALVLMVSACGPGSPPLPEPPWTEDYERQLPEAAALCEAASSAEESGGSPDGPVLTLLQVGFGEEEWYPGPEIGLIEAESPDQVQTLVCIEQTSHQVGTYSSGGGAYRLEWTVRLVRLSDGAVLASERFTGGEPPERTFAHDDHGEPPTEAAFNWVASTLSDRTVICSGAPAGPVAFGPDGQTVAFLAPTAAGAEPAVHVWDVPGGGEIGCLGGEPVVTFSLSPDGQMVASGGLTGAVKLWEVATGAEVRTLSGLTAEVGSVAFSADGQTVAALSQDTVKVWDVETGAEVQTVKIDVPGIGPATFSPDLQTLAFGSEDGALSLWDLAAGSEVRTLRHKNPVQSVAFSPDGQVLASGTCSQFSKGGWTCVTGEVRLWDANTGKRLRTLKRHAGSVLSIAFAPDGQTLAAGGCVAGGHKTFQGAEWRCIGGEVRVWQVSDGALLHHLEGHRASVEGVAFAPGGETLASSDSGGVVKLWDLGGR